jgi:outer membrane PBP1 activator LpoA protein
MRLVFISLLLSLLSFSSPCLSESHPDRFVVGLILPLSGELADYGAALRRGFELAEEDAPERFKYLDLRYQDSQYDQKTALSAFRFLEQQLYR